jgi:hypothetical protein
LRVRPRAGWVGVAVVALLAAFGPSAAAEGAMGAETGFLSAPTDQIAVPGMPAAGEITPEGDLYTGWAEYEWRFGSRLAGWNQPTRTLPDPGEGLLSSSRTDGSIEYTQTVFAVPVAGQPVAYETFTLTNRSREPRLARLAMTIAYTRGRPTLGAHGLMTSAYRYERPVAGQGEGFYEQPGQLFSPSFDYTVAGRDLDRSGLLLARGPAAPSAALASPPSSSPIAAHDGRVFAVRLAAGARASVTWQIPLSPPDAGTVADVALDRVDLADARSALRRLWGGEEAGMMRISVPEARVAQAYRAAIMEILESRYETSAGWVQAVNRLQYQSFWIRDAAMETNALDLAGLHLQAGQDLAFMDTFQQPSGLFISRVGQYDGLGQALWALDRHAALTGDAGYAAAQLQRIGAAIQWLSASTASDPLGLLPAGTPGDDELASGHITGDDLWAAAGLRSAVADARLAGREDLAVAWQAVDTRFEASLDSALSAASARAGGHIPPVLDAPGGQDWGNYYAAYPVPVLAPSSPEVSATLAWARAHSAQGLPTYLNGTSLHDYLGFALFQTELERGEASRAVAGLYSELAHTTSTDGGWEWGISPHGYRGSPVDMSPHGTFAADYVALLRDMLVSEQADGSIELLAGASPAWLAPGRSIAVSAAPTSSGVVSFSEHSTAAGETVTWRSRAGSGARLVLALPWWARHARTAGGAAVRGGKLALSGTSGTVTVLFGGSRPRQSYAREVASLDRSYRAHGHSAPIGPATG